MTNVSSILISTLRLLYDAYRLHIRLWFLFISAVVSLLYACTLLNSISYSRNRVSNVMLTICLREEQITNTSVIQFYYNVVRLVFCLHPLAIPVILSISITLPIPYRTFATRNR